MRIFCAVIILIIPCIPVALPENTTETAESRSVRSWWDAVPRIFTEIFTMKANALTAAPLEWASNTIDALCKNTVPLILNICNRH